MRGYWLPPGYEKLEAFDGFFLKSDAVFISDNPTRDWDMFLHILKSSFTEAFPDFKTVQQWETVPDEEGIYVLLEGDVVKLIVDDSDGYIAVYLIVQNKRSAQAVPDLRGYISALENLLCSYYPKSVYRRINYRELQKIDGELNGR